MLFVPEDLYDPSKKTIVINLGQLLLSSDLRNYDSQLDYLFFTQKADLFDIYSLELKSFSL